MAIEELMDQDNTEILDNQNVGELDARMETESSAIEREAPETDHVEAEVTNKDVGNSPVNEAFTKDDVERIVQERLARDRRKRERGNDGFNQPYQPVQQPYYSQQQYYNQQPQDNANLTPEQIAENKAVEYLKNLASQEAHKILSQQQAKAESEKAQAFVDRMKTEAEKLTGDKEYFDDFYYEAMQIAKQFTPNQINGMSTLFELSQQLDDPRVLFEIHKQNPDELKRLAKLPFYLQAAKLGEYRGRSNAPARKVVSKASSPIQEPTSKTSSYQKSESELSATDLIALKRSQRRAAK